MGAYVIIPEPITDERGFFARSWCKNEFSELGMDVNWVQSNISYNKSNDVRPRASAERIFFYGNICSQ